MVTHFHFYALLGQFAECSSAVGQTTMDKMVLQIFFHFQMSV